MNLLHGVSILIGYVTITLDFCNRQKSCHPWCFITNFLFSGFVKWSTKFNFDLTNSRDIIHVSSSCHTILCLKRICLFFSLNILLLALAIVAWLSQCIDTSGVGLILRGIFSKRLLSHSTSKLVFSKVINLVSIVEWVMQVYLADFKESVLSQRVEAYPLVDFISYNHTSNWHH